jgi:GMP synthase-like glutamine amidotransferase
MVTLLFEAIPEPEAPVWQQHTNDLDQPTPPFDYLTYVNTSICPYCCEDVGSVFCGHDIHIDEKGTT